MAIITDDKTENNITPGRVRKCVLHHWHKVLLVISIILFIIGLVLIIIGYSNSVKYIHLQIPGIVITVTAAVGIFVGVMGRGYKRQLKETRAEKYVVKWIKEDKIKQYEIRKQIELELEQRKSHRVTFVETPEILVSGPDDTITIEVQETEPKRTLVNGTAQPSTVVMIHSPPAAEETQPNTHLEINRMQGDAQETNYGSPRRIRNMRHSKPTDSPGVKPIRKVQSAAVLSSTSELDLSPHSLQSSPIPHRLNSRRTSNGAINGSPQRDVLKTSSYPQDLGAINEIQVTQSPRRTMKVFAITKPE